MPRARAEAAPINFNMDDIRRIIPRFDPRDKDRYSARDWVSRVEVKGGMYHWTDQQLVTYAAMALAGPAHDWYEMSFDELVTWENFKTELINMYPEEVNVASLHIKLASRKRRASETIDEYYNAVVMMAKKARVDEAGTKQYLVRGLSNEAMRMQLSSKRELSMTEFLREMRSLDESKQGSSSASNEESSRTSRSRGHKRENTEGRGRSDRGKRRYSSRDRRGNYRREARDKSGDKGEGSSRKKIRKQDNSQKRCYRCDSKDHLIAKCPKKPDFLVGVVRPTTLPKNKMVRSVTAMICGEQFSAFVDNGSHCSLIQKSIAEKLGWFGDGSTKKLLGLGGGLIHTLGELRVRVSIQKTERFLALNVVPDSEMFSPILIGFDYIDGSQIEAVQSSEGVIVRYKQQQQENAQGSVPESQRNTSLSGIKTEVVRQPITREMIKIGSTLTENEVHQLMDLLNRYRSVLAMSSKEIGHTKLDPMTLVLKEDKIVRYNPYRVAYSEEKKLQNIIEDLLAQGIIEESDSEYASPVILVKKADGGDRMVVDYRQLNAILKHEYFPMPHIEEELQKLVGKRVFISLDLMQGYHQMEVHPDSRKYTAFVVKSGQYQYKGAPYGLQVSSSAFMRMVTKVLRPVLNKGVQVYVDDILIGSVTVEEALAMLEVVLQLLAHANLTVNARKCCFLVKQITYLGHLIDEDGVSPGETKVAAVSQFSEPQDKKGLRQFLGLTGYFRRFIPNYSGIAGPLYWLLKDGVEFEWKQEQDKAFRVLKYALTCEPVLVLYDPKAEHELHTDGCSVGIGGVLMQVDANKVTRPVAYFSRCTTDAEAKWHSFDQEALAVVEGLRKFRYYLLGKAFTVYTDCRALEQAYKKREVVPKVTRWWLEMAEYSFEIRFRGAKWMEHADCLSRNPIGEKDDSIIMALMEDEDWVAGLQSRDGDLIEIRKVLEGSRSPTQNEKDININYVLKGRRIYRKTPSGLRFVLPRGTRWNMIRDVHEKFGHLSADKTTSKMRETFWFSKLAGFVKNYVKTCVACNKAKPGIDENRQVLHTVVRKPIPFNVIHLDHSGPYPRGRNGAQYILAIVDSFTKYVILRPVKAPNAAGVIKVLNEISEFFGMPETVVTDQGSAFMGQVFQSYCEENSVKHAPVAVRTPKANGQVERYFRVVGDALKTMVQDRGKDWVTHLRAIQWGINSTKHRITKQTPQKMLLGYTPRDILGNQLISALMDEEEQESMSAEMLQQLREKVCENINRTQEQRAEVYNLRHKAPMKHKEGDVVLVRHEVPATGGSRKLLPKYRGPYMIQAVLNNDRYEVSDTPSTQLTQRPFRGIYTADDIKPWGDQWWIENEVLGGEEDVLPEEEDEM